MMFRPRPQDSGFVLVNALIIAAAMAAVAVFLLARAEEGRVRLEDGQEATQLALYLDAFDALAVTRLTLDDPNLDHDDDQWAQTDVELPVDRGAVNGSVTDMQGRFNLNWLSNPSDDLMKEAFRRLASDLSMSDSGVEAIISHLAPGGGRQGAGYRRKSPPIYVPGGALTMPVQLGDIPGLSADEHLKLSRYFAVIPTDSVLNLNTVSPEVLSSILADVGRQQINRLLSTRNQRPFASVEEVFNQLSVISGSAAIADLDPGRFSVNSKWFLVQSSARLGGQNVSRETLLHRLPLPRGVQVVYRLGARG